jgi:hypothetical protein
MARPQFAKVNGKTVCIVSASGVRKKGAALMRAANKERKQQIGAKKHRKQAKADNSTASEDIHNENG